MKDSHFIINANNIVMLLLNLLVLFLSAFAGMVLIQNIPLFGLFVISNVAAFIWITFYLRIQNHVLNLLIKPLALYILTQGILTLASFLGGFNVL